jgi:2-hydroxyglutarate dehydrogenase
VNGVAGLRWLDARRIAEVEPNAVGVAAVHSPNTGVTDFAAVTRRLAELLRDSGGEVATGVEVRDVVEARDRLRLVHSQGTIGARFALFCAGAWSDRLAVRAGAPPDPRIIPFRGAYLLAEPTQQELVQGMIYPVPDPALPFLGVHLTRHIDGTLSVGPTAMLSLTLRPQRGLHVDGRVLGRTLAWRGTMPMAWHYRGAAAAEMRAAAFPRTVAAAAREYAPSLNADALRPGPVGVRAQALSRSGKLVDDFVFSRTPRALHVRNAPSPAATSSLAIARYVADEFVRAFEMQPLVGSPS